MRKNTSTMLCLLILMAPNIAAVFMASDLSYSVGKSCVYLATVMLCLLIPATMLKRRMYFIVEGIAGLFWSWIEIASLYMNKMPATSHFIGTILDTNKSEAMEVMGIAWPAIALMVLAWAAYWIMVAKMDNEYIFAGRINKLIWIGIPTACIGGFAAMAMIIPNKGDDFGLVDKLSESVDNLTCKFQKIYPYDIYLAAWELREERKLIGELNEKVKDFRFGLSKKNDDIEEHYVVIIGESARYDHFHINGYNRETSPYLDKTTNIYSMANMYSEANLTHDALELILTRADISKREIASKEKSIVEAFAEAGFETAWISNQTLMDYALRMSGKCNYKYETIGGLGRALLDSVVVGEYGKSQKHNKGRKTFSLIHCMGSHFKYNIRYPDDMEKFEPAIKASDGYAILSSGHKDLVVNSYDNTIVYTDFIISSIIKTLSNRNGVKALMYISDHGENLYDDARELCTHGSYDGTVYESHIPCFVWLSDEFINMYPEKAEALKGNLEKQVTHSVAFHSLADMGGLNVISDKKQNIFSSYLSEKDTIRMLTGNGELVEIKTK